MFENALCFHGCHQATTSIGRDEFDLQILNSRLREINDAQNRLVVQAIVDGQEQRALFRGSAAQNRRNTRGQFGYRDLLIRQGHLTVLRDPLPCRGREDGARRGTDTQDQLGFGNLSRRIGGGSRDIDVVASIRSGTTTINMISSTSTTSTSGVMLISDCRLEPASLLLNCMMSLSFCARALGDQPTPRKPSCSIAIMTSRTSRKLSFASPLITILGFCSAPTAVRRVSPKCSAAQADR